MTLEYREENVTEVRVKYFDSLPPCSSICVLKTGFLFAASEFGNHSLYQFAVRRPPASCLSRPLTCVHLPTVHLRGCVVQPRLCAVGFNSTPAKCT